MIDRKRLVRTFCDLAAIDSPSGEEEAVAQELARRLTALGFQVQRDAYANLIALEEGESPLILSAHMDTVEPGRGVVPQVQGDLIVSDGTTVLGGDCKAGISAILEALESIREDGTPRAPVQVVLTREEEQGLVGAKNLDTSLLRGKEAIVFDGQGSVNRITSGSPTYLRFDIRIRGRAAHAGVEPERGLSAIRIAAEIIAQLPQGRLDWETTFNVGMIGGGSARNAVPETATASGEMRSFNERTLEELKGRLAETLQEARQRYPEAVIEEEIDVEFRTYTLDPEEPIVRRVAQALGSIGLTPTMEPSGGGTDGNIFRMRGIQAVVMGMADINPHTVREQVDIPRLMDVARFCQALLTQRG